MAFSSTTTDNYRNIITSVKRGNIANIYILAGEEPYFIDGIADAVQQNALAEEERDFNQHIFYGPDLSDLDIAVGAAKQYPVMSSRKLVMVKDAQGIPNAKKQFEKISQYCKSPTPSTILVITYKGRDITASTKWVKEAVAAGAVYFNSPIVASWNLDKEVKAYCSMNKISIEPKALSMLSDYIGCDMGRYFGELDKLKISEGNNPGETFIVTPLMVERNIGMSKDYNNFELTAAVMTRDYTKAMRIVNRFGKDPKNNPPTITCATLFNAFSRLLIAHYAPSKTEANLKQMFNLKAISAIRELQLGLRNYSAANCVNAIHSLREFDRKCKGVDSMQKDTEALKELIYYLFTK